MASSTLPLLFFLLSVLLSFGASSSYSLPGIGVVSGPSRTRSHPRAINYPDAADAAVDLSATNFDAILRESPTSFAIVEFVAHWSPACRNYKPRYEKVARLFNGPDAVHPGIVLMTRVDCALKEAQMNAELCERFSISHYPMLLWGPPPLFASGGWEPKQQKSGIKLIDDRNTADRLLNWINKQIGSEFNLEDEKHKNERHPLPNASDPKQIIAEIGMRPSVVENVAHELYKISEKMADIWGKRGGSGSSSANLSGRPGAVYFEEASVSNGDRKEAPGGGGVDGHISRAAFGNNTQGYSQDLLSARKANK